MLSVQKEQRVNIKFCFKLGKSASETFVMLQQVYGDDCLSRTQVFEWFKRFKDGREDTSDDIRTGRPLSAKTDANIEKIGKLVRQDRRLTIRAVSEITGVDKESVRQILHESFNMNKVCSKMVPKWQ
jgi:transposase